MFWHQLNRMFRPVDADGGRQPGEAVRSAGHREQLPVQSGPRHNNRRHQVWQPGALHQPLLHCESPPNQSRLSVQRSSGNTAAQRALRHENIKMS